jgi:hypothetical protein
MHGQHFATRGSARNKAADSLLNDCEAQNVESKPGLRVSCLNWLILVSTYGQPKDVMIWGRSGKENT